MHNVLTRRETLTGASSAAMPCRRLAGGGILALLVCLGMWLSWGNPPDLAQAEGVPAGAPTVSQTLHTTASYSLYLPLLCRYCTEEVMPYGVQILDGTSPLSTATDRAQHAQMQWVRCKVVWSTLEPADVSPNDYNWAAYDDRLYTFANAGLRPIVTITGNPSWAAPTNCGPIDPAYMADFKEFIGAVVARYSQSPYNVKVWEIYNEPDNADPVNYSWLGGCWGEQGAQYADMLKAIYPVVKAADPDAQVAMGGLAYDNFSDLPSVGPFNRDFLDDVIQANGAPYFDVMNFHFYKIYSAVWEAERPPGEKGIEAKANYLRAKLAEYGVTKPFICTETSMWSDAAHGGSDALQSRYVVQAFVRGLAADLDVITWFRLADSPGATEWLYGLLNSDLSRKPAYAAYQTITTELAQVQFVRRLTAYDTGNENIEGYEFEEIGTGKRKGVLWTNNGASYQMAFPVSQPGGAIRWAPKIMYHADGTHDPYLATIVIDGGPYDLDSVAGQVTILIGPDPAYVSAYP